MTDHTQQFVLPAGRFDLRCRHCGAVLAAGLTRLPDSQTPRLEMGEPALPPGVAAEGARLGEQNPRALPEAVLLDLASLQGVEPAGERNGCCGPDGCDGPNLRCACGTMVGTEFGDCWMPHCVRLPLTNVEVFELP